MTVPAHLGPFDLAERIGEGGMGALYRAIHRETGVPVAIKVIRRAVDAAARRRFHEEIQAHAGLQHPNVVYLFEYGNIDAEAASSSADELRPGDPFVAMELAERGTVRDAMPIDDWETVCRILVQILDALAYSHARGVIHRDLKPENFLVFDGNGEMGADWRVKLADFGIAHALAAEPDANTDRLEAAAGTPLYMAPEQLRGEWRSYGPWTDLYALGCIAWELVCGRPPFRGDNALEIAISHETNPFPPLDPQIPVPDELESWIHRAMAPDLNRRFQRAADAAWTLPRAVLADGPRTGSPTGDAGPRSSNTVTGISVDSNPTTQAPILAPTVMLTTSDETARTDTPSGSETAPAIEVPGHEIGAAPEDSSPTDTERLLAAYHPPIPEDWRPGQTESLPAPLVGAGLGLFGLREPPFINRTQECDRIWEALHDVVAQKTPRTVFITGEAGTGKSRLAERMAIRAHEVGSIRLVRAVHTPGGGPNEGLSGALERTLRCAKMKRGEVFEHLLETLPPLETRNDEDWLERDARALTEYLRPTDDEADEVDGPRYRFSKAGQTYALIVRVLERLADSRPLLLWVDDLQWGAEALGVLEHLDDLDRDGLDFLVLATVRSDVVGERPQLQERIEDLADQPAAEQLQLTPLSWHDQRELLVRLLPLENELADTLAERTEGHPLFGMQLLGHWIEENAVEVGPDGFRVAEGRQLELPENIHDLWQRRLERFIAASDSDTPDRVRRAIERAAALGREVDGEEWRIVGGDLDLEHLDRIRDGLIERGLAERNRQGWAFAHGLIVDSLERRARREGRWQNHHRRCAALLEELYRESPKQTATRRANHWIQAGRPQRALKPLMEEVERLRQSGQNQEGKEALEQRRQLLNSLEIPEHDPRCVENDIEFARINFLVGAPLDSVRELLDDVRVRAGKAAPTKLLAKAWRISALCRRGAGELDAAGEAVRKATELGRQSGNVSELVEALYQWGWLEYFRGNLDEAENHCFEAYVLASDAGEQYQKLKAYRPMAFIAMSRSEDAQARRLLIRSLEESRRAGYRGMETTCLNGLGEIARFNGDAEEARARYRRFGQLGRELHLPECVASSHLNLAQVELMARQFAAADRHLQKAEEEYEKIARKSDRIHLLRLAHATLAAGTGDWSRFDELSANYADGWPEDAGVIKDYPWLLEMAGDCAAESGERERAERMWPLARELWNRLGDAEARERVNDKLEG